VEIGGYDLIFKNEEPVTDLGKSYRANYNPTWDLIKICRRTWKEAVVQFDAEQGHFYVYKNMAEAIEWDKDVPSTDTTTMIYFIIGDEAFTAVVGSLDGDCVADLKHEYDLINKEPI
jgi:hypothetical protein